MSESTIVGALFVALGAGFGAVTGWLWRQAVRSASWPSVTGRVRGVDVVAGRHSTAYRVAVRYAYVVDGASHHGERMSVDDALGAWTGSEVDARGRAARYPVDSPVTVYYDPARPGQSALSRGRGGAPYERNLAIAVILFVAGWGAILGWVRVG